MNNSEFLVVLRNAYAQYIEYGERSTKKLKNLHEAIASDLQSRLGARYIVKSDANQRIKLSGRYYDKCVDISVTMDNRELGGIGVKFPMSNYSQNSNNYFECMLGETANIRSCEKAYFQIVILPEKLPYFEKGNNIKKYEAITDNNLSKYVKLSNDSVGDFMHAPNKTLLYIINTAVRDFSHITNREQLEAFMRSYLEITPSQTQRAFGNSIIYNDYNDFIIKISHYFQSM